MSAYPFGRSKPKAIPGAPALGALSLCVVGLCLAGCGSDDPPRPEPGPFVAELECPNHGNLPFVPNELEWRNEQNEADAVRQPRIKHQPADVFVVTDGGAAYTNGAGDAPLDNGPIELRGIVSRTQANRGLVADPIPDEWVSGWEYSEADGWVELGEQPSTDRDDDIPGTFAIGVGEDGLASPGISSRYSVLGADSSCGEHLILQLPAARQVIFADLDATMTLSDSEIISQVPDANYDPVEMPSSVALTKAWEEKGYQMIYLTARPHVFRSETRRWLREHGYAEGPVITAPDFVSDEAARAYKGAWVSKVRTELGWDVVAAYGNADSDIDAYEDAGIDKATTFVIGPLAGTKETVAIDGEDYADHIDGYVAAQPDANHL